MPKLLSEEPPLLQLDLVYPLQSEDFIHADDVDGDILHPFGSDDPTEHRLHCSDGSSDIGVDSIGRWPLTSTDIRAYMSQLPELDFTGVETLDFVADRDGEETAEVSTRHSR